MAEVLTLKKEEANPQSKIENFMTRNRVLIIAIGGILLALAAAVCICVGVIDSQTKKGINQVDAIEYEYVRDFAKLSEEEIVTRQNTALEALKPLLSKKNVVGVRANMLAADIAYAKKDFTNSMDYNLAAARLGKNAYTVPVSYFNAASCCEELGNNADAATYYELACEAKSFPLKSHAEFNLGRVKEALGDLDVAAAAYQKLVDEFPGDEWANLAQSRLILLKSSGKIN